VKATGIVRKIDTLGRIVLPVELRRMMSIKEKDPVEIFIDGESIILKKYKPGCSLCGSMDDVFMFADTPFCKRCASGIGAKAVRKEAMG
jgi:transcriptional pleiotropic regulator of transition state genes